MFAQVSSVQLQPGKMDEWITLTQDSILPAAKDRPGFINAYILVDREKNTGIGISLWNAETDIDGEAASGFYQDQVAKAVACLDGPPERHVFEVAVQL
jgi:hypothetical protein